MERKRNRFNLSLKKFFFFNIIVAVICLIIGLWPALSFATFVAPKRLYIEDHQRTARLIINNRTDKTMVYSFGWQRRAQDAKGDTIVLEEGQSAPGYRPADPYLQFSPRQVVVPPKGSQTIRILVRRPADLAEGEYHSHFLIKPVPLNEEKMVAKQPGVAGMVQIRTNLSLPVFLRQGDTSVNIDVTDVSLYQDKGVPYIKVLITNDSTRSIYAKSVLECQSGGKNIQRTLPTVRLYNQAKTINRSMKIPDDFPLSSCSNLIYKLVGIDDFELKRQVIDSIPVRR